MKNGKMPLCALLMLASCRITYAEIPPALVPNGSFEEGDSEPAGWTLNRGQGQWLSPGATGQRAIAVTGDGTQDNAWLSTPIPWEPNTVYRLQFRARRVAGTTGLPVSGPVFCNRDLVSLGERWTNVESYFVTPQQLSPDFAPLRFGQWEVRGTVAFDDIHLSRVIPVHRPDGAGGQLGLGERLEGNRYVFSAPLGQVSANFARPLAAHQCQFNSNRWVLSESSVVTYCHAIGRLQQSASVQVTSGWYLRGELVIAASRDGEQWETIGTLGSEGSVTCPVPAAFFPADAIWIRFTARAKQGESQPPALQVHAYQYEATWAGPPVELVGATQYFAVSEDDEQLSVSVVDVGEALPGGRNRLAVRLRNRTQRELDLAALVRVVESSPSTGSAAPDIVHESPNPLSVKLPVTDEDTVVELPYEIPGVGGYRVLVSLSRDACFTADTTIDVPTLHAAHYGHVLPPSNDDVGLWWCSSGWKVGAQRPLPPPTSETPALRVAAAANETEAAQLVIRPARQLTNLTVTVNRLCTAAGEVLEPQRIDIARVTYVHVTQPTDESATTGLWPDPLVPVIGPWTAEAHRNLPMWIRVHVPPGQRPGVYGGEITLQADQYVARVPIQVEVFGFALPDRMTCETAFGFDPSLVWRYHGLETEEQRRVVLDKYLQCLADHHIAPYNPAPLDPIRVEWQHAPARSGSDVQTDPGQVPAAIPEPVFDFTAWDRAMQRAMDQYHFTTFQLHVPGLGGGTFHARYEPELLGFAEGTPQYEGAMQAYLGALQSHLRARGWLDRAFVYWFDEPDPKDYDFVNNGFAKLKKWAPDIRRMLTEQVEPGLVGGPNVWCPLSAWYDHAAAQERRKAGEQFWWYVCTGPKAPYCTLFIDHPGTELRVWLWQTWQRSITGILVWQTNYWTSSAAYPDAAHPQNPYADPMGWVSGYSTAQGVRQAWGNGDGRFLYPPESAAAGRPAAPVLDGPVPSIRLEMLRDGVDDYEYLVILRRRLAERRAALTPAQIAEYEALLDVPPDITTDLTTFTTDPAPIEQRRAAVARAIEQLSP
ncbi:MAG: DUF4091 domain-containing protein [Pirellulaceae bacterium]|nr:DUF4091 domain-containing protein [Pirellulaceae bacterium]